MTEPQREAFSFAPRKKRAFVFIGAARRKVSPAGDERGLALVYVTNNPSVILRISAAVA